MGPSSGRLCSAQGGSSAPTGRHGSAVQLQRFRPDDGSRVVGISDVDGTRLHQRARLHRDRLGARTEGHFPERKPPYPARSQARPGHGARRALTLPWSGFGDWRSEANGRQRPGCGRATRDRPRRRERSGRFPAPRRGAGEGAWGARVSADSPRPGSRPAPRGVFPVGTAQWSR